METKASEPSTAAQISNERRRTQRVRIAMSVVVQGTSGKNPFKEETQTISVNAHGCVMRLAVRVERGQRVSMINPKTSEEQPCTVVFLGQTDRGKTEVGVEFAQPSPMFWRIAFPPVDWDPSERKRPETNPAAPAPSRKE